MTTTMMNYFFVLGGEYQDSQHPDHQLKLFDIMPGDQVTISWWLSQSVSTDVQTYPYGDENGWLNFTVTTVPGQHPSLSGDLAGMYGANWVSTGNSNDVLSTLGHYLGTTTFQNDYIYSTQVVSGTSYPAQGAWAPGDGLYLNIWNDLMTEGSSNNLPDLLTIQVTLTNDARSATKVLPSQFTSEQRAKFVAAADALKSLANMCNTAAIGTDPTNLEARLAGTIASKLASSIDPQVGAVNAFTQTALKAVDTIIKETTGLNNPAGLTLKIAGAIDGLSAAALKALARDPADGNYTSVFQAPDWPFGTLPGLTTAEQSLLVDSWSLMKNTLNMLAACERYQGAAVAGDAVALALQRDAFDAALIAYESMRLTVAADVDAARPDLATATAGVDLGADTSYSELVTYLSGLTDPATQSTFFADFIAAIATDASYLSYYIGDDVTQAVTALIGATAPTQSGMADAALDAAATELASSMRTAFGDFGGYGVSDILLRNVPGVTYLWTMDGTTVANGATTSVQVETNWQIAGVGDFDGDGRSDLLWVHDDPADPADPLNGVSYASIQNGAVATSASGVVQQLSTTWQLVGVGDLTGDGKADVLYRGTATGLTYLDAMNGAAIDWSASGFTSAQVTDAAWSVAAVADFGGDGKADILWRYHDAADAADPLNGTLYEWTMNGTSVAAAGLLSQQASDNWQVEGTGDFDGDGNADILFRYENSANAADVLNGVTYIDFMNGTTVLSSSAPTQWQVDLSWAVASIGDYNGDGMSDILWQQTSTGTTYIWQMNGANIGSGAFTSQQAGTGWTVQNGVLIG